MRDETTMHPGNPNGGNFILDLIVLPFMAFGGKLLTYIGVHLPDWLSLLTIVLTLYIAVLRIDELSAARQKRREKLRADCVVRDRRIEALEQRESAADED